MAQTDSVSNVDSPISIRGRLCCTTCNLFFPSFSLYQQHRKRCTGTGTTTSPPDETPGATKRTLEFGSGPAPPPTKGAKRPLTASAPSDVASAQDGACEVKGKDKRLRTKKAKGTKEAASKQEEASSEEELEIAMLLTGLKGRAAEEVTGAEPAREIKSAPALADVGPTPMSPGEQPSNPSIPANTSHVDADVEILPLTLWLGPLSKRRQVETPSEELAVSAQRGTGCSGVADTCSWISVPVEQGDVPTEEHASAHPSLAALQLRTERTGPREHSGHQVEFIPPKSSLSPPVYGASSQGYTSPPVPRELPQKSTHPACRCCAPQLLHLPVLLKIPQYLPPPTPLPPRTGLEPLEPPESPATPAVMNNTSCTRGCDSWGDLVSAWGAPTPVAQSISADSDSDDTASPARSHYLAPADAPACLARAPVTSCLTASPTQSAETEECTRAGNFCCQQRPPTPCSKPPCALISGRQLHHSTLPGSPPIHLQQRLTSQGCTPLQTPSGWPSLTDVSTARSVLGSLGALGQVAHLQHVLEFQVLLQRWQAMAAKIQLHLTAVKQQQQQHPVRGTRHGAALPSLEMSEEYQQLSGFLTTLVAQLQEKLKGQMQQRHVQASDVQKASAQRPTLEVLSRLRLGENHCGHVDLDLHL